MTQPRREGDSDEVDYSAMRNGFSWTLPFSLGTVSGRGWLSIVALLLIGGFLTAGALVYVNFRAFEAIASDHKIMLNSNDRLACIVSMTADERTRFREGGAHWLAWCPWLESGK